MKLMIIYEDLRAARKTRESILLRNKKLFVANVYKQNFQPQINSQSSNWRMPDNNFRRSSGHCSHVYDINSDFVSEFVS